MIESDSDCTEMEGTSMVNSNGGIHNVLNNFRRHRKHSDTRKEYGKKKHVPSNWQIGSPIVKIAKIQQIISLFHIIQIHLPQHMIQQQDIISYKRKLLYF
jgi:hypothetical protein